MIGWCALIVDSQLTRLEACLLPLLTEWMTLTVQTDGLISVLILMCGSVALGITLATAGGVSLIDLIERKAKAGK